MNRTSLYLWLASLLACLGCVEAPPQSDDPVQVKPIEATQQELNLDASAYSDWVARHNMTGSGYQSEFDNWVGQGYRLTQISGYEAGNSTRFAALWEKKAGPAWRARHGMTSADYNAEVQSQWQEGYRPVLVDGYEVNGQVRFAAIFHKKSGAWFARHGMTASEYQDEYTNRGLSGYRLVHISGYSENGSARYAAIWDKEPQPTSYAAHGLDASTYQFYVDFLAAFGYKPVQVEGYFVGGTQYYAAIWHQTGGPRWQAAHGLTSSQYNQKVVDLKHQGYRPVSISGYGNGSSYRFAALWHNLTWDSADLDFIDSTVQQAMNNANVRGLSLAFSVDGRLVFAKGYGTANTAASTSVTTASRFRFMSVSKPLTSAAIYSLVESGVTNPGTGTALALDDTVFGSGGILEEDYGDESTYQTQVDQITLRQLLEHTSGLADNSSSAVDPMFRPETAGMNHANLITWVITNLPLQSNPGSTWAYSNFGYCVLGRVIEKLSGQTYESYVNSAILNPSGVSDMVIGQDTLAGRYPNEAVYYASDADPYSFEVNRMDSHGGWVATPIDMLRWLGRVDGFASPSDLLSSSTITTMTTPSSANPNYASGWMVNSVPNWWHNGVLAGTRAQLTRLDSGINYAAVVNESHATGNIDLDQLMWDIIGGVGSWPAYDNF